MKDDRLPGKKATRQSLTDDHFFPDGGDRLLFI